MGALKGRIAVVTGASRGAGRGIAYELGQAGATVYVTGRSTQASSTDDRPETIEQTAAGVTARGGLGIPVRTRLLACSNRFKTSTGGSTCSSTVCSVVRKPRFLRDKANGFGNVRRNTGTR